MGPAKKRVALIGFCDTMNVSARLVSIDTHMKNNSTQLKYVLVDTFYTGPYSNRTPTQVSFIEFGSSDMASQFCKHVENTKISKTSISGCEITVKTARAKIND